ARRWASGRTGTAGRRRSQPPVPGQASTGGCRRPGGRTPPQRTPPCAPRERMRPPGVLSAAPPRYSPR
ncbi:DNA-binding protein, partial [Dysosmobacter welbionis]